MSSSNPKNERVAHRCEDGAHCTVHWPQITFDGVTYPARDDGPALAPDGRRVCDRCILGRLNLLGKIRFRSDDRLGLTELILADEARDAFAAAGLPTDEIYHLAGSYDPQDTRSSDELLDADGVAQLARTLLDL